MPTLYDRLKLLKRVKRDVRVEALVRTIPHASSHECDAIVAELIELAGSTDSGRILRPVFRQWECLSPAARSALISASSEKLKAILDDLRASEDSGDRAALGEILIGTRLSEADGAGDELPDRSVLEALDASLAQAADGLPGDAPAGLLDRILDQVHAPGPHLRGWLSGEAHAGHMRLRAACRKRPKEWLDEHAVAMLGLPALSAVAASHMSESDDTSARAEWLRRSHLLLARGRRGAILRHTDDHRTFELALSPTDQEEARVGATVWLTTVCRNRKRAVASLASSLTDPSDRMRLASCRSLRRLPPGQETDDALTDFAFDSDARVAETASVAVAEARSYSRDQHLLNTNRSLARSASPRVRRLAQRALERSCPSAALRHSDDLACPIAARRMLSRDRAGFVTWLKGVAHAGGTGERIAAFQLADRLNVLDELEAEIVRAVREPDERLVSKVALLMGKLKGSGPGAAMRFALSHGSDRVRANAVESFARVAGGDDEVQPFMGDNASRVRANAIRHFLKAGRGELRPEDALLEMLADGRAGHRLSALWAAQSSVAINLAGRIDDMSKNDPDERVVTRARSCSGYFSRLIRSGWSDEKPPAVTIRTRERRHVG